ncbi:MAG: peptidoglycan-binding protein [Silicimonas sp.]|nr:peptidoglycan-binding protein [Silicimonas sp.]
MTTFRIFTRAFAVFVAVLWAQVALAQSWVQVEALPNEARAIDRANDYAAIIDGISSYRLRSGWYGIVVGPFATEDSARGELLALRGRRVIPNDSFVADGRNFREQVFGSDTIAAPTEPAEPLPPLQAGEETPEEARRGERLLGREERAQLQTALKWEGFYNSVIDASFGAGTRRAMAAWQENRRYEPTGILTTLQRRELVEGYLDVVRSLEMRPVIDTLAGIEVEMPSRLVTFDRYETPFVHYKSATDDGVKAFLISQSGDQNTLTALYDILQTLEVVPVDGPRTLRNEDFFIEGQNNDVQSYTYARLTGGTVKGFSLIWPAGDTKRFTLARDAMLTSFSPREGVLPDTAGTGVQDIDLLAGLEIRRADRTRSGFYIDKSGAVLTTTEAVRQCGRVMVNEDVRADVVAEFPALGLALLRPTEPQTPIQVARLAIQEPRLQSDIALAGYSFGGLLSAPSLSFGTLADIKGLDGDTRVKRLSVANAPGDAGGPVFDGSGAVLGMLLDANDSARTLPGDVAFAVDAPVLAEFLSENGVSPAASDSAEELAPEDLTLLAADLTVLVSCWN